MNKTILFLLLIILSNCVGQKDRKRRSVDHYKTAHFDVAIFPSSYSTSENFGRFTPTRREIDKAEFALQTKLQELNKELIFQSSTPELGEVSGLRPIKQRHLALKAEINLENSKQLGKAVFTKFRKNK